MQPVSFLGHCQVTARQVLIAEPLTLIPEKDKTLPLPGASKWCLAAFRMLESHLCRRCLCQPLRGHLASRASRTSSLIFEPVSCAQTAAMQFAWASSHFKSS